MKMAWRRLLKRLSSATHRKVMGLLGVFLVCIWGFAGFWSWWERDTSLTASTRLLEQLTGAVQAQTKGLFKQADSVLLVADQWIVEHADQDPRTAPAFIHLMESLHSLSGGVLELRLISKTGDVSSVPDNGQASKTNVLDRDYFRAQFDEQTRGFYIGTPVQGKLSKRWILPISKLVETRRGQVYVLLVVIQLDRLVASFEAERIKPSGTIGIVRKDGTVLFRSPLDEKTVGMSIAQGQAWKQYFSVLTKGSYDSEVSLFDKLTRQVSFAEVDDYPLVVYVSASKDDLLEAWRAHSAMLAFAAVLVSVFGVVMGAKLMGSIASARIFEAIIESTDEAVIGTSLQGIVTSWNPGASRMFGYGAAEMLGQSIRKLLPPDRVDESLGILEKIQNGDGLDHFETMRRCKNGRVIDVSVTISPIRDKFDQLIGASKIARDITERKRAEAQLQLTASVFTNTSEGILITNRAGEIVEVNEAFTRITGYPRDEVMGFDPSMFRSSRQGPEVFNAIRMALARTGGWKGELWSRRKDGEAYSTWLTVSKIKNATGRTTNYVALFSDVTVLKLQQEKLEYGAHFDALTNLPNRLLLSDRLQQAMTICRRHNQNLAVLYMDLDGFKVINDRYGHAVGDELLIAVSGRMRAVMREFDTLARMGGDEFVAVLSDVHSVEDCVQMVARVVCACAQPVRIQERDLRVTVSIGVTMYPQDNAEADQLMRHADQAMYEAKQSGKNKFHLFDAVQDAEAKNRGLQQEQIAKGLTAGEFLLYYQPKVNMRTGAVIGAEALIRWQHPELGLLAPGAFLPVIENHPLSEVLGAWVLETAVKQMSQWMAQGLALPVSVNVAARQIQHSDFALRLAELLSRFPDVDAHFLELEVLETSALDDIRSTSAIMQDCHRLGVRFAIDDFGTGYSSLTYLRHLPVETLKIDQSFVRDMLEDHNDLSIVNGVVGLAVAFHREVIAEGVETIAHGKRLLEIGCDLGQGYAIARPMPAEQVRQWCASWKSPYEWL